MSKKITVCRQAESVCLSAENFSFEIEAQTGMLRNFQLFGSDRAQWDDTHKGKLIYKNRAGVSFRDDFDEKVYSDPFGMTKVFYHEGRKIVNLGRGSNPSCSALSMREFPDRVTAAFDKTYDNAPFDFKTEISVLGDHIRWDMVLRLKEGFAERSVSADYELPFFRETNAGYFPAGWHVWAPLEDAPYVFGHSGGWGHAQASWYVHKFPYCSTNAGAGIGIPLMDVYSVTHGLGMALAAPLDLLKPELVFVTDKERSQLKLHYGNIGLRKGKEWRTSLLLYPHKGDWRESLGWFHRKHRDYFLPNNPKITAQEGTMWYGTPELSEKTLKSWSKNMRVKWTEVLCNSVFGDYIGSPDKWDFDMLWHKEEQPQKIIRGLTRDKIKKYLGMLKKHGVASFMYFNFGDCSSELANEKYKNSIVSHDHGIRDGWFYRDHVRHTVIMNPDMRRAWGKEILRQAEEIFDVYEDLDGLFIDQLCYHSYDYSRDDGETMVESQPVFDTHRTGLEIMEKIGEILRRKDKTCFANGPYNIEIMRYADGIMSEGSMAGLAKYSLMCLEKPVMILTYNVFGECFERVLKACLKYGAFPSTPWHHDHSFAPEPPAAPPKETMELYKKYLPLLEFMRGRKWVLTSNPVEFPDGLDGNIFHRKAGGYAVPFFKKDALLSGKGPQKITVRAAGLESVREARWLSTDFKGEKTLPVIRDGEKSVIEIPFPATASVILL
jgi:hypothetical protein